jgi:prepilin-type N-terminal cleavage/methylation domain-containing protein
MRPASPARSRARRARGFTVIELSMALAITSLVAAGTVKMIGTSNGLAAATRGALRSEQECMRNLSAVKNVLRGVAWTTLTGFDASMTATAPSFQRVVDTDDGGRVLGPVERLEWRAASGAVKGIASHGDVVLVSGGVETVLARRVVANGFRVVREGYLLRVRLSTWAVADGSTTIVTRESAVSVRN